MSIKEKQKKNAKANTQLEREMNERKTMFDRKI